MLRAVPRSAGVSGQAGDQRLWDERPWACISSLLHAFAACG